MKNPVLILYLVVFTALGSQVKADDRTTTERQEKADDPGIFATVNGRPLSLHLYHFLLGYREQDSNGAQAYEGSYDAEMNRQQSAKDLVMTEVLAQKAEALGMDESELVKVEMVMAKKTLLAQLYVQKLMDSIEIDESEIRHYYDQQREQAMYRFMIWQTTEQDRAEAILSALETGNNTGQLPDPGHENAIETPWLRDVDIEPEVHDIVGKLDVGEYAEKPIFQDGFWKVVRVIDKDVLAKQSFDEERELIKAELVQKKLDEKLEELAENASITFNEQHIVEMN